MLKKFGFATMLVALVACGGGDLGDPAAGAWECTVSLTLEPATFGDLSSPSGSGTGNIRLFSAVSRSVSCSSGN